MAVFNIEIKTNNACNVARIMYRDDKFQLKYKQKKDNIEFCRYSKRMGATIPTEEMFRAEYSNFRMAVPIQLENRLCQRLYFRNYRGCNAYSSR